MLIAIKKKYIFILDKSLTDGVSDNKLAVEKEYSINFTEQQKKFCLRLNYNRGNRFIFVNVIKSHKSKAKDSEILNAAPLCLCTVLKDVSVGRIEKTGLYSYYVYVFWLMMILSTFMKF